MNFEEAEKRFRELQAKVQRGDLISGSDYEDQINKLVVEDQSGLLWKINPRTSKWTYFDGTNWVTDTPPQNDLGIRGPSSTENTPPDKYNFSSESTTILGKGNDFERIEKIFRELQARTQRGEPISGAEYEEEVAKLVLRDLNGTLWRIDPRAGKWIYFNGSNWVTGTPREHTSSILSSASGIDHPEKNLSQNAATTVRSKWTPGQPNRAGPLQVFLCHSSDDKPVIRKLYKQLQIQNIDPWLDEEKLLPGESWKSEITKAVRSADIVIVCLSQRSVNKEGFVQKEIKLVLDVADEKPDGTIFIIPVKLEECPVPERLQQWHWLNYFEPNALERLMAALRKRGESLGIPV